PRCSPAPEGDPGNAPAGIDRSCAIADAGEVARSRAGRMGASHGALVRRPAERQSRGAVATSTPRTRRAGRSLGERGSQGRRKGDAVQGAMMGAPRTCFLVWTPD